MIYLKIDVVYYVCRYMLLCNKKLEGIMQSSNFLRLYARVYSPYRTYIKA